MRTHLVLTLALFPLLTAACTPTAHTSKPASLANQPFCRIAPATDNQPYPSFQTRSLTLSDGHGAEVTLVSSMHIGEPDYYRALQNELDTFDVICYELVKTIRNPSTQSAATRPADDDNADSFPSTLARYLPRAVPRMMALTTQDALDYASPKFTHADVDSIVLRYLRNGMEFQHTRPGPASRHPTTRTNKTWYREPNGPNVSAAPPFQRLMTAPDKPRVWRTFLAELFTQSEVQTHTQYQRSAEDVAIIDFRNLIALECIKVQLRRGHTKIALLYGGGHMPDIEYALARWGFTPASESWLTAWSLGPTPPAVLAASFPATTQPAR